MAMKVTEKEVLAVGCPTCGAKVGEKCQLGAGIPRIKPHRDRRLAASESVRIVVGNPRTQIASDT